MNLYHTFTLPLLTWFYQYGRKDLPWQNPRDPYRVWISEIMLQQTQVKTVIPYFIRFMDRFPTLTKLANATEDEVLSLWSGLGYYSRARNIHKTANQLMQDYGGIFPQDLKQLLSLPGIGDSTAAAIASLAYNQPTAILDGNVKRILSRYFLISGPTEQADTKKKLWQLASDCMSLERCADYTQAIMDFGAICCTKHNPGCIDCPLQSGCQAYQANVVADYPQKKHKLILPKKEQQFLVIHRNHSEVFLEKRPPTGLWGGLWCLPSIEMNQNAGDYLKTHYGAKLLSSDKLMTIKHTFSHFHLTIHAMCLHIEFNKGLLNDATGRWVQNTKELDTLGLAKPVRTIIDYFL